MAVTTYNFRNASGKGNRYSVWARFCTGHGVLPVLEWFPTYQEASDAADTMLADGRFREICIYCRGQEVADAY